MAGNGTNLSHVLSDRTHWGHTALVLWHSCQGRLPWIQAPRSIRQTRLKDAPQQNRPGRFKSLRAVKVKGRLKTKVYQMQHKILNWLLLLQRALRDSWWDTNESEGSMAVWGSLLSPWLWWLCRVIQEKVPADTKYTLKYSELTGLHTGNLLWDGSGQAKPFTLVTCL